MDDVSYLDIESISGTNLFMYCNNNPVMYADPDGNYAFSFIGLLKIDFTKIKEHLRSKGGILADLANFSIFNEDEQVVLESNYFSYYKGSLVIRHSISKLTSCGIFNMIFLKRESSINTLKHEWGHYVQGKIVGTPAYILRVAIQSVIGYAKNVPYEKYYSQPWEITADYLGRVERNNYNYTISNGNGMVYLLTGMTFEQWNIALLFLMI